MKIILRIYLLDSVLIPTTEQTLLVSQLYTIHKRPNMQAILNVKLVNDNYLMLQTTPMINGLK
jgi:hypothetical protein